MRKFSVPAVIFALILYMISGPASGSALSDGQRGGKKHWWSIFKLDIPRWQILVCSSYAVFEDYESYLRKGGGAGLFGLFKITSAISVSGSAVFYRFGRVEGAGEDYPEEGNTEVIKVSSIIRYDIDIADIYPYFGAGGSIFIFTSGIFRDIDPLHWGPDVEVGLDWNFIWKLMISISANWSWLVKYSPPPGMQVPLFFQATVRLGGLI